VVGAGGIGCPALAVLGAAGCDLTIADGDAVELSNLNRQILHRSSDLGRPKVESARDALYRRFPSLRIETVHARIEEPAQARALVRGHDVVLDGTDSFAAKLLLSDACVDEGVRLVHGGCIGWRGQLMSVTPGSACVRCLFEDVPAAQPSCQEAGILGAVAGLTGARMAEEALAPSLIGRLRAFDVLSGEDRIITVRRRESCDAHARRAMSERSERSTIDSKCEAGTALLLGAQR
jgi:adenylyltransferase/sulfurtransferase